MQISKILLITKNRSRDAFALSLKIKSWLQSQGVEVVLPSMSQENPPDAQPVCQADLIMVLGGDGTILNQARKYLDTGIPFLGVNLGQVGFMADISPHSWKDQLSALLASKLETSRRMVLEYQLVRNEEVIERGPAVNEVVINRGQMARLINIELNLPGGVRQDVRCDGMIFSSPTGSTAYCVSAGGPLVHQDMQAMIVTPICPFLHDFRPLVLEADSVLEAGLSSTDAEAFVTVDGQVGFEIRKKDRLKIFRHARDLTFVTCPDHSFISKLAAKRFLKRRG